MKTKTLNYKINNNFDEYDNITKKKEKCLKTY